MLVHDEGTQEDRVCGGERVFQMVRELRVPARTGRLGKDAVEGAWASFVLRSLVGRLRPHPEVVKRGEQAGARAAWIPGAGGRWCRDVAGRGDVRVMRA